MRIERRWSTSLSTSVALMLASGCGGGAPAVTSAKTEATVKGTVMVKGKLAKSGSVVFDAANAERRDVGPISAPIGPDGTYSVKTLVGPNRVLVSGNELIKMAPEIQTERLEFDVKGGENTYNIDVPTKK